MPKKQVHIDIIDPTKVNYSPTATAIEHNKSRLLDLFLQQQEEKNKNRNFFQRLFGWKTRRFKKGAIHEVYLPNPADPTKPIKKKFKLTHDIVFSHIKIESIGRKIPEYNIIDPDTGILGKGVWGTVIKVAGVLTRRNGPLSFKATKNFVDKIQSSSPTAAEREAKILKKLHYEAKRILVEKIDLIQKVTHIVDRNYGVSLTKVMQDEASGKQNIDFEKRLLISVNLLRDLQRVHAFGYVHHDIWPNNVLVDPATGETHVIDFGSAKKASAFLHLGGKKAYAAPEKFSLTSKDHRTDIFSLSLCLAVFWGAQGRGTFEFDEDFSEAWEILTSLIFKHQDTFSLATIGQNLAIPTDLIPVLQSIFASGLSFNPEDRASLDQIINSLEHIRIQKQFPDKPEVYDAHLVAHQTRGALLKLEKSRALMTGKKGDQNKEALTQLIRNLQTSFFNFGDSAPEIKEYIYTLGIKSFDGLTSKRDILQKASKIVSQFLDYNTRLQKVYNNLEGKLALFKRTNLEADKPYVEALQNQLNQIYYVIYKMESHSINLDELVKINRHCEKRLQVVETTFAIMERDSKFKAPNSQHTIFNRLTLSTDENPKARMGNNVRLAIRDYILHRKTSAARIGTIQDLLDTVDNPKITNEKALAANLKKPLKELKNSLGIFQGSELYNRVKKAVSTNTPRFKAGRLV